MHAHCALRVARVAWCGSDVREALYAPITRGCVEQFNKEYHANGERR